MTENSTITETFRKVNKKKSTEEGAVTRYEQLKCDICYRGIRPTPSLVPTVSSNNRSPHVNNLKNHLKARAICIREGYIIENQCTTCPGKYYTYTDENQTEGIYMNDRTLHEKTNQHKSKELTQYRCDICNMNFKERGPFQSHQRSGKHKAMAAAANEIKALQVIEEEGEEDEEGEEHEEGEADEEDEQIECDVCTEGLNRGSVTFALSHRDEHLVLKSHILAVLHCLKNGSLQESECNICKEKIYSYVDHSRIGVYTDAYEKHEKTDKHKFAKARQNPGEKIYCELCDQSFKLKSTYQAHCASILHKTNFAKANHIKLDLTTNFYCPLCNKYFLDNYKLNIHKLKPVHTKKEKEQEKDKQKIEEEEKEEKEDEEKVQQKGEVEEQNKKKKAHTSKTEKARGGWA